MSLDQAVPLPEIAPHAVRPSARPCGPVRHRDVGALFLLRHACAARAVHGEASAARAPAHDIIGFGALRAALEWVFGPLGMQPLSSQIYGLYTALVYLTPIFGGLVADRLLGQRRTVVIGAVLMAIGHFMMALESLFLLALFVLILANGAFKPNISTQVGRLYPPGDPRRDRAYSIFYVGINLGAFLAPLDLRHARRGGRLALRIRRGRRRHDDRPCHLSLRHAHIAAGCANPCACAAKQRPRRSARPEWGAMVAPCWSCSCRRRSSGRPTSRTETPSRSGPMRYTDRGINLLVWHGEIPATWFQAFNPFMIFAFTPPLIALWSWQARRGREPSTVVKMAFGCFGVALANLVMAYAAMQRGRAAARAGSGFSPISS